MRIANSLRILTLGLLLWGRAPLYGQVVETRDAASLSPLRLDEIDGPTRARLQRVRRLLDQQDWEPAMEELRRLCDEHGDQLVSVNSADASFSHFVPLVAHLHRILCTLSDGQPVALAEYRRRVDGIARRWYEQGLRDLDERQLNRLVRELFPSSWTDNALLALGDLALERGDYERARVCWRRLHRDLAEVSDVNAPSRVADPVVYPDSEIGLPDLRSNDSGFRAVRCAGTS